MLWEAISERDWEQGRGQFSRDPSQFTPSPVRDYDALPPETQAETVRPQKTIDSCITCSTYDPLTGLWTGCGTPLEEADLDQR